MWLASGVQLQTKDGKAQQQDLEAGQKQREVFLEYLGRPCPARALTGIPGLQGSQHLHLHYFKACCRGNCYRVPGKATQGPAMSPHVPSPFPISPYAFPISIIGFFAPNSSASCLQARKLFDLFIVAAPTHS